VSVFEIDPLVDPRWPRFVETHAQASVFHSVAWLTAIRNTYGFQPFVHTTAKPEDELQNGIVYCPIRSWITGNRLVSLPFSDHCEPLLNDAHEWEELLRHSHLDSKKKQWQYVELRPVSATFRQGIDGLGLSKSFVLHKLDLEPSLEAILKRSHKDCVQRKIRRAEREKLHYEDGHSEELINKFYSLFVLTRRRQRLPPTSIEWFKHLAAGFGGALKIRIASNIDGVAVAAILTLSFKNAMVYKYGASDSRFNNLGATPFLFWKAIEDAKALGLQELDLGRSDKENLGLIAFKEHLGGAASELNYLRSPLPAEKAKSTSTWKMDIAGRIFERLPDNVLCAAGKILYPHVG
jgi:hypothetical protein